MVLYREIKDERYIFIETNNLLFKISYSYFVFNVFIYCNLCKFNKEDQIV